MHIDWIDSSQEKRESSQESSQETQLSSQETQESSQESSVANINKVMIRVVETPMGRLIVEIEDGAVISLLVEEEGNGCLTSDSGTKEERELADMVAEQLQRYFAGKRVELDFPVRLTGTEFQKRVYAELMKVRYGFLVSYGELARRVGCKGGARAIGGAVGRNPLLLVVPCHRVIASDGKIGGFSCGLHRKRFLLNLESNFIIG